MERPDATEDRLTSPERINFFKGQLLTDDDFGAEQLYFVGKDQRHNCSVHGTGVICGLGIAGNADGTVTVEPGMALDGFGREIIVPEAHRLDPMLLTDEDGGTRDPRADGTFLLCLKYREAPDQPTPSATGFGQETVSNRTTETYRLLIRSVPSAGEASLSEERGIVVEANDEHRRKDDDGLLLEALVSGCSPSNDDCVVLGAFTLHSGSISVDQSTHRQQLSSTAALQQMLVSLARRVSQLEKRVTS
jgi:hypothetical protein